MLLDLAIDKDFICYFVSYKSNSFSKFHLLPQKSLKICLWKNVKSFIKYLKTHKKSYFNAKVMLRP